MATEKTFTMQTRPSFLTYRHETGADMIARFRQLPQGDAADIDHWLIRNVAYGALTWQERCLYDWINEMNEIEIAEL